MLLSPSPQVNERQEEERFRLPGGCIVEPSDCLRTDNRAVGRKMGNGFSNPLLPFIRVHQWLVLPFVNGQECPFSASSPGRRTLL